MADGETRSISTTLQKARRLRPYEEIAAHYRAALVEGRIALGAVFPSENEVAAKFGVSRMTVRRSLQLLRDEGRLQSVQGFGWVVGMGAAPPESPGRTRVAFLYPRQIAGQPQFEGILRGFHREARAAGVECAAFAENQLEPGFLARSRLGRCLLSGEIGSLAVFGSFPMQDIHWLITKKIPTVQVGSLPGSGLPIAQVGFDLIQAYYESAAWLLSVGKTRLRVPLVRTSEHNEAMIYGGVLSAMDNLGRPMSLDIFERVQAYGAATGEALASRWLAAGQVPDGVIASDEAMGLAIDKVLRERGHACEVVLLGSHERKDFTVVKLDRRELGRAGCRLLLENMRSREPEVNLRYVPVQLKARRMTDQDLNETN